MNGTYRVVRLHHAPSVVEVRRARAVTTSSVARFLHRKCRAKNKVLTARGSRVGTQAGGHPLLLRTHVPSGLDCHLHTNVLGTGDAGLSGTLRRSFHRLLGSSSPYRIPILGITFHTKRGRP